MVKARVNWGRLGEDCSVKLYEIYNTSHHSLLVLARDEKEAMSIAYTANHVYDPSPKIALTYSRLVHEVKRPLPGKLLEYSDTIESVIEQRLVGTVHFEDGRLAVGHEVIAL